MMVTTGTVGMMKQKHYILVEPFWAGCSGARVLAHI